MIDETVRTALNQLRIEWPTRDWSWDDRLAMVSSAVSGEKIAAALRLAAVAMPLQLDAKTLDQAPAEVRAFVGKTGGLRGEQLVFSAGNAFGLWWPWGGGGTVSLRIGLVGADADDKVATELRDLFGVELSR